MNERRGAARIKTDWQAHIYLGNTVFNSPVKNISLGGTELNPARLEIVLGLLLALRDELRLFACRLNHRLHLGNGNRYHIEPKALARQFRGLGV